MFICFITGNIRDFLVFNSIIIVHELGHIFGGVIFSWKIDRVIILPFGGLTIFNCFINTSLFEQFIVTLMGPLFQIIFYFIISHLFCLSDSVIYYNYVLLFFNLLPIYPLDGSKFLYVFLCFLFPFKFSHILLCFSSLVFIIFVLFFIGHFDLLVFLILLFLCFKVINEVRNHKVIFNKFLFERYNYDFYFRCVRRVKSLSGMYLWCRHLFYDNGKCITEREKLLKMFDNHYKLW
jgi:stage IV sporulation protein FB